MTKEKNDQIHSRQEHKAMNDAQEKICETILSLVNHWVAEQNPIAEINTETVRSLGLSSEEAFNYSNPQLTKDEDVYLSTY